MSAYTAGGSPARRGASSWGTGARMRRFVEEALPLFHRSIELDPEFAAAHAMAAWCIFWRKVNGWSSDPLREVAEGARLARRAVELGRDDERFEMCVVVGFDAHLRARQSVLNQCLNLGGIHRCAKPGRREGAPS